jgi:hypothetical protein
MRDCQRSQPSAFAKVATIAAQSEQLTKTAVAESAAEALEERRAVERPRDQRVVRRSEVVDARPHAVILDQSATAEIVDGSRDPLGHLLARMRAGGPTAGDVEDVDPGQLRVRGDERV